MDALGFGEFPGVVLKKIRANDPKIPKPELVGGFNPFEKILVKLDHFPR